ncbi:hypothetical protein EDD28_2219 [Salana multivorans]|uniref:Hydrolytic protein n=1 Tax=Salana multivorans TaxID=120377 RepID=A0A3N2DD76_9MICO|nr:hypothetical protein [Salana multivorans]MBN8882780.1 hypothetical protein [Salana multivorans]OJX97980.1 MAG: hypothetical protein BGO96_13905 [Micrococcales bacterium 73-15]ROR97618.1 hypothetical protein EDD28_2219 [Salana multivorans]
MTTTATLDGAHVRLVPGEQAVVPLSIRNGGTTVEGYRIEILGVPASWATVEPARIDGLYPDTSTTATITFAPPRSASVAAGTLDYGVRVVPIDDATGVVVPEGTVEVLPYLESTAEILPRTSTGRMGAKHQVAIDNRGNTPVSVTVKGADEGKGLRFAVDPEYLTVAPGEAAFTTVRVKPPKRIWRGADTTFPFAVTVAPANSTPVILDAAHVQRPTLPPWFLKALLALLALLLLLVALWFLLVKPAVSAAARAAVAEDVAAAQSAAEDAKGAAEAAQGDAAAAGQAADAAAAQGEAQIEEMSALREGLLPATEVLTPTVGRLETSAGIGGSDADSYVVPSGQTLRVYSLLFNNPQGDFGTVTLSVLSDAGLEVVTELGLENFRDSDFHFQTPIVVPGDAQLRFSLSCRQPGTPFGQTPPPTTCAQGVSFGGNLVRLVPVEPGADTSGETGG